MSALKVSDQGPIETPRTYREAINSPHAEQWKVAMREDLEQIEDGEIVLGEYSAPTENVWVDTTAKLMIRGKIVVFGEE